MDRGLNQPCHWMSLYRIVNYYMAIYSEMYITDRRIEWDWWKTWNLSGEVWATSVRGRAQQVKEGAWHLSKERTGQRGLARGVTSWPPGTEPTPLCIPTTLTLTLHVRHLIPVLREAGMGFPGATKRCLNSVAGAACLAWHKRGFSRHNVLLGPSSHQCSSHSLKRICHGASSCQNVSLTRKGYKRLMIAGLSSIKIPPCYYGKACIHQNKKQLV